MTIKEFPLKNGERLRIATTPVKLGNGAAISRVEAGHCRDGEPDDERAFLKNPYGTPAPNEQFRRPATNDFLPFVDHTSEADLVRAKIKDGDEDLRTRRRRARPEPQKPVHSRPGPGARGGFDQGARDRARESHP